MLFKLKSVDRLLRAFYLLIAGAVLGMPVTAMAEIIADQIGATFRNGGYTGGSVVQSFTPTANNIVGIDADYTFQGQKDITLTLHAPGSWTGTGFSAGSDLISTSLENISSCGSSSVGCLEFRWTETPIAINPGETYYFELNFDGGAIGAARTGDPLGPYAGGEVLCPVACGNTNSGDLIFTTYTSAVPIPPAVYLFGTATLLFAKRTTRRAQSTP